MSEVATRTLVRGTESRAIAANGDATLLEVIRAELGVRSASRGCDDKTCGACRVLLEGEIVSSCALPWRDVLDGARLETYEDIESDPAAIRAVASFDAERTTRCKLCVGALGVTAVSLARGGHYGDPDRVEAALTNATCMCTGRGSLRRALLAP